MGTRGRKSLDEQSANVVTGFASRLAAPVHLTPEQARGWREIVDSLPGDYFRPGDVPLLAAFCVAAGLYKQATAAVADDGMVMTADKGRLYAHPGVSVMQNMAGSMAQMAVKLRLCPSARYTAKTGATKAGSRASGARPWEAAQNDS